MERRFYIRCKEYVEGQYSRLEGGHQKSVQVTINDEGNLVLGNPRWDRLEINFDDLREYLDEMNV